MTLHCETFTGGPFETNAYLVADTDTGEALAIDAPQNTARIIKAAADAKGWRIGQIVLTHSHWDHIADAVAMRDLCEAPIAGPVGAEAALAAPGTFFGGLDFAIPPVVPDRSIGDGDTIALGGHRLAVLHLPGHEPFHIALYDPAAGVIFSGDVVFPGGAGRTDLPGADPAAMHRSLRRLLELPAETTVYPGHGAPTTIAAEADWMRALP
ncbi:MAG: MBL fold metallo-hydrolase [Thermomicrobiales bacterium]|nr:MBL fold metallo-hydrolase [Thermomicrobiales bacterium]